MTPSRRQFALMFLAAGSAATPFQAWADDDDEDYENVFISPSGQPFRAAKKAPYPVVDWFNQADKNHDGKLDHAEFIADAEAFFKKLDLNGDGVLSPFEIQVYEYKVAPEVLGYRVKVGDLGRYGGAKLWRAQMPSHGGGGGASGNNDTGFTAQPTVDESRQGAAPYGFFEAPEPVAAADLDFRGLVTKANFLTLADMHFTKLDRESDGYLTLAKLPKTPVQKILARKQHRLF